MYYFCIHKLKLVIRKREGKSLKNGRARSTKKANQKYILGSIDVTEETVIYAVYNDDIDKDFQLGKVQILIYGN